VLVLAGDVVTSTAFAAPSLNIAEPLTLAQAKEHLRVVNSDDDAYIADLIVAARTMAEGKLNRTIVQRRRVVRASGWGSRIRLLKPPVVSLDNVGYYDETGGEMMLDVGRYYLAQDDDEGIPYVELRAGEVYPLLDRRAQAVTAYYTAGYAPDAVPASIVQWIKLAIGTMYNNRESVVNGAASAALGDDFARWLLQPHVVYE
jgi:uncharacterized phiE125 gp8 family phage protein